MAEPRPTSARAAAPTSDQGGQASRWHILFFVPYLGAAACAWLCWAAGYVGIGAVAAHHATSLALILGFHRLGQRPPAGWSAQRLSQIHLILSAVPFIVMAYPMQHMAGRVVMLMVGLNAMAFGMLALNTRRYFEVAGCFVLAYGCMLGWMQVHEPERISLVRDGLIAATFFGASAVLAVLGGQINRMRRALRRRTVDLDEAVQRLSMLALHDALTGLPNRRALIGKLADLRRRQVEGGQGFAIGVIDIDFFKRVNDVHGHAAGDAALRAVADVATAALEPNEIVGRWGGEEFLFVVEGADGAQAGARAETLRQAIERDAAVRAGLPGTLTISVGMAVAQPEHDLDAVLARADAVLYEVKACGRNQVGVASGDRAVAVPAGACAWPPRGGDAAGAVALGRGPQWTRPGLLDWTGAATEPAALADCS